MNVHPLAQTVGSQCNLQNLGYKLQDLSFSCKLLQEKDKKEAKQNPSRAVK
jgi:hypothetical protein